MAKHTKTQRNFRLGQVREGFLEADESEIRAFSCRKALNVRVTATDTLAARPGTAFMREAATFTNGVEIRPSVDEAFGVFLASGNLYIMAENGAVTVVQALLDVDDQAWIEPYRDRVLLGDQTGVYELVRETKPAGWSIKEFKFESAAGSELAQPYWSYEKDILLRPSAKTGSNITLTASKAFFHPDHVLSRIRYGGREVLITSYVSQTVVRGSVRAALPPSYKIVVKSGTGFKVGDAVIGLDTDYQGLIVSKSGNTLYVVTVAFFEGPDIDETLSAPSTSSAVVSKTEVSPLSSPLWDEPLMSKTRGFPRSAASAGGRLAFVDFPQAPDVVCLSSSRSIRDFRVGDEDDDAIVRKAGDNSPRFLHVVNAGDLVLLSDRGIYYVPVRDSGALSPSNFGAVLFDSRSASPVRPVAVDDGVVFVEASNQSVAVAALDGNIYLKWSVRTISTYHSELIKTPVKLSGPSLFSSLPEKYLFVVNADGTMAAVSWISDFAMDSVGFVPWETQGAFRSIFPLFGSYAAIVDRDIAGTTRRFLEKIDYAALMDCQVAVSSSSNIAVNGQDLIANGGTLTVTVPSPTPFANQEVWVSGDTWTAGKVTIGPDGVVADLPFQLPGAINVGFNFESRVQPWPVEHITTPRAGMLKARLIRGGVSMLKSTTFMIRANKTTRTIGGYAAGDDMSKPAPLRTKVHRFSVVGNRDHPEIEIIKSQPAPFEVMAITQEVQA